MKQVIDVPKIIVQDPIAQRAVLRAPQLVEQLVDVPLPRRVTLAGGKDGVGHPWSQAWVLEGVYCWKLGTQQTQWTSPDGFTAGPRRYVNTGQG